ncbi:hypothetical protein J4232_03950 [Candidatus Woesearchaeota archaeon]|nr:hypothetical protein [Candidatus Woesearchaeota archaeon]
MAERLYAPEEVETMLCLIGFYKVFPSQIKDYAKKHVLGQYERKGFLCFGRGGYLIKESNLEQLASVIGLPEEDITRMRDIYNKL